MARPGGIGIGWQVGVGSGWGVYGLNLAVQAARLGVEPHLFLLADPLPLDPLRRRLLGRALRRQAAMEKLRTLHGGIDCPHPVLHALGDGLDFTRYGGVHGQPDLGVAFIESATIPAANLARARDMALIIAGSTWNAQVMAAHGLTNVRTVLQGIDRALFHPPPPGQRAAGRLFPGRFLVFSGGKLEYRKGQDLVVAAFRAFRQRHPEALLVTAWHNLWPDSLRTLAASPHISGLPAIGPDRALRLEPWLEANGLPADSVLDLGVLPNHQAPQVLAQCDVGLFPNRCEGGTNLVAMEAMACGLPVILSRNTGHLDLVHADGEAPRCYRLDMQLPVGELTGDPARAGWGESLIDEAVAALEAVHADRAEAARRGAAAAAFMADWDWSARIAQLLDAVGTVG